MLKKILIGLGVVIVLLVATAVVLPMVIPVETYKDEITNQVRAATGRDMAINGDMSLSVIPTTAVSVNDVTFSNAAGGRAEQMATLKQLDIEVKLFPLLSGRLELDRLVLIEPVIHLEVDENGRPNWQFGDQAAVARDGGDGDGGGGGDGAGGGGPGLQQIQLGDVRLVDGLITYTDMVSGRSEELRDVDVTVSLPDLQSPFDIDGDFTWNGEEVALEAHLEKPLSVLQGGSSAAEYSLSSRPVDSHFDGMLTNGDVPEAEGEVSLDVPSVKGLAAWVGNPIEAREGTFGPLNISGRLAAKGSKVSFDNAQLAFDNIKGTGAVSVETGGSVPYINATLDLASLDINPYIGGAPAQGAENGGGTGASGDAGGGNGARGAQGWSTDPIDASALRTANADVRVSANQIQFQKISVDRGAITAKLSDGTLALDLTELALYEGKGKGRVVVDGSGQGVTVTVPNLSLTGLAAQPFLTDAADYSDLSGTAEFQAADIRATGASQEQLVSSVDGHGSFAFRDGSLAGTNLALALRQITSMGQAEAEATDFTEMAGTFTIADGVVTNDDLTMLSQLLRVAGEGTMSLPPKTVDYKVTPRGVLSLKGQGGPVDVGGVVVPVRLVGPWHDVRNELVWSEMKAIAPDGSVTTPTGAALDNLPPDVKEKIPGGVLEKLPDLLGGGGAGGGSGGGAASSPEDVIQGILGDGSGGQEGGGETGGTETGGQQEGGSGSEEGPGGIKLPGLPGLKLGD